MATGAEYGGIMSVTGILNNMHGGGASRGGRQNRKGSADKQQSEVFFIDIADFRDGKNIVGGTAASELLDALRESNAALRRQVGYVPQLAFLQGVSSSIAVSLSALRE